MPPPLVNGGQPGSVVTPMGEGMLLQIPQLEGRTLLQISAGRGPSDLIPARDLEPSPAPAFRAMLPPKAQRR